MTTNQENDEAFEIIHSKRKRERRREKKLEANMMLVSHYEPLLFIVTDIKLPHHNTMLPHTIHTETVHTLSTYHFIHYSMGNNADTMKTKLDAIFETKKF